MSRSKKRQSILPAILIMLGLVIVFGAASAASTNDIEQSTCELDQVMDGGYADCEDQGQGGERAGYIIGGGMIGLGVLGLVIISAMGSVIDNTARQGVAYAPQAAFPSPPPQPTQADELRKAADLLASGAITAEEFAVLKRQILGTAPGV